MNSKYLRTIKLNNKIVFYLNHLELVNQCLSSKFFAEARSELHKLEKSIQHDEKINPDVKALAVSLCDVACAQMVSEDNEKVLPCMFSLNQMAIKALIQYLNDDTSSKEIFNKNYLQKALRA